MGENENYSMEDDTFLSEGLVADDAKEDSHVGKRVLIGALILLGLAIALLVAFLIYKDKKKIKNMEKEQQENQELKDLEKYKCSLSDADLKEDVNLGTVQKNKKDGFNVDTYSGFTETTGLNVSDEVKKAISIEGSPNISVESILGPDGKELISDARGLKVENGKLEILGSDGKKTYFSLDEVKEVKLGDGQKLNLNDLKVMDNVTIDGNGNAMLLSGKTKGELDFSTDKVKANFFDENKTNYFSFETKNINDQQYSILKDCLKNKASVLEKNKVANKFTSLWLEKRDSDKLKVAWHEKIEDGTVKYQDLTNKPSKNNLETANTVSQSL